MNELEQLRLKVMTNTATNADIARLQQLIAEANTQAGAVRMDPNFGSSRKVTYDPSLVSNQGEDQVTADTANLPSWLVTAMQSFLPKTNIDQQAQQDIYGPYSNFNASTIDGQNTYVPTTKGGSSVTFDPSQGLFADSQNQNMSQQPFNFPNIYGGGSDISTELYSLGRALGAPAGSKGRLLTGISSAGAAAADIARNIASGIGYEKRNQYVMDWYRKQQQGDINYVAAPQYMNDNTRGGVATGAEGGQLEEGQFSNGAPQAGDQQSQMQQIVGMVVQMLQEGQKPEEVIQNLTAQGMPPEQAQQIVMMVIQQSSPSNGMEQSAGQGTPPAELTMKNGGLFNRKPGDKVTFLANGKKETGVIKEIRNGEIFLK